MRLFCFDIEAKKGAEFTGLNRGTVNNIFNKLRERMTEICEDESPFENGQVELDEGILRHVVFAEFEAGEQREKKSIFGMLKRG